MTDSNPKPSIGRIVHFYSNNPLFERYDQGNGPFAAIVTKLHPHLADHPTCINLTIFPSFAAPFWQIAEHEVAADKTAEVWCYWKWPPRE